ncbi:MAG: hypothetical protein ABIH99_05920 [Candidatus Micrarchaeota archaeon]
MTGPVVTLIRATRRRNPPAVDMRTAIRQANARKEKIAPNLRVHALLRNLVETSDWEEGEGTKKNIRSVLGKMRDDEVCMEPIGWDDELKIYPVWCSPLLAYKKPGEAFGSAVSSVDPVTGIKYTLEVPSVYKNEHDCVLAVAHDIVDGKPTFEVEEKGNEIVIRVSDEKLICLLENFPEQDGWYPRDEKFGIPLKNGIDLDDPKRCYLVRADEKVTLIVRGPFKDLYILNWLNLCMNKLPYEAYGLITEKQVGAKGEG